MQQPDLEINIPDAIQQALREQDKDALLQVLDHALEIGDLADCLLELGPNRLRQLLDLLGEPDASRVVSEIDPHDAAVLLDRLAISESAEILDAMAPDDATDILAEFPPDEIEEILIAMDPVEAEELRELAIYPPDSAGGRMTPEFVAVDPTLRADQAVSALRTVAAEAETINYVYITDDDDRLLGVLSLRSLVLSPPGTPVRDLMADRLIAIPAAADQEEAARLLIAHDLFALPVVDADNRLLGIITGDDVADILQQEATEDIERLGGSEPLQEPYLRASPLRLWRKRILWLLVLFFGASYTTTVIQYFEDEIEAAVMLSFYIPLLIGTGGNVGSQVVTTLVRAMSVEDVRLHDVARVVTKEMQVGLMLGTVMATVMFARAVLVDSGYDIAAVVGLAVFIIVLWATLVGATLPLVLRRLNLDPAVVSAPLITTVVDGTGLVIYFMIARTILNL